jgi:threonine/homoserine/homoserine lactone efflux protein
LSPETVTGFFTASLLLALAPGPDNILVLTQSALYGRKTGILITLGLCTGLLGHTAAVVLGVAALIKSSALAFSILKLTGAAYLLYLAWKSVKPSESPEIKKSSSEAVSETEARSGLESGSSDKTRQDSDRFSSEKPQKTPESAWKLYTKGILMNITNPKVAMFFIAFFPQFVDPKAGNVNIQMVMLGLLFILATVIVFGSIALMAGTIKDILFGSEKTKRIIDWLAASVFAGLAVKLAVSEHF